MSTTATVQELKDTSGVPQDPNVRLPDSISKAGKAAEELHARLYSKGSTQAPLPTPTEPTAVSAPQTPETPPKTPEIPPQPAPVAPPAEPVQPPQTTEANVTAEEWRHRFLSMQGRFNAQKVTIGSMEQQMSQLGAELMHVQNQLAAFQQGQPAAASQPNLGHHHEKLITDQDRHDYGDELIDLARRAGREAVAPELARLQQENQRLTNQVKSTTKRELLTELDRRLPTWRQINKDTRFITWLRLPNIYTGQVRKQMLDAAVEGANAPLVLQFFNDFLREAQATGQMAPAPQNEQQAPSAAPRQPAVALETLAAPGRAKPASGESAVPSEKPIYTRAFISQFYKDAREAVLGRGPYAGRSDELRRIETDLGAAQREGRIR